LDGVDKSRDRVPRFVCRHFGVPPALIGLSDPEGWGNAQAFKNKLKLFALMTISHQNLIIRTLKKFMPDKEIFIGTLNIVDYIDPALVDKLTADEQRNRTIIGRNFRNRNDNLIEGSCCRSYHASSG
jgi:hypothetical protein